MPAEQDSLLLEVEVLRAKPELEGLLLVHRLGRSLDARAAGADDVGLDAVELVAAGLSDAGAQRGVVDTAGLRLGRAVADTDDGVGDVDVAPQIDVSEPGRLPGRRQVSLQRDEGARRQGHNSVAPSVSSSQ